MSFDSNLAWLSCNAALCWSPESTKLKERLKLRQKRDAFVCPGDGKWPDETDCGKYHNCQGSSETSGWCGPGMSFDTENQRCEMALAINCKDGDRPDWKPPDNCNNFFFL